ncbi:Hsp33 family molecular chaperone HslO [Kangiella japonica]|uniref:Hsp33 family molecular chaperone HslO n=1 Tax=Kangiella japonica TaxID=647384 RepID=A0ABN0SY01_9GAMM
MSDSIQRFTFSQLPIRGEIVTLETSYQTIVEQHQYPAAQRQLLGQALAANALLAEMIKIDGKVALQLQSQSAVKLLLTECTHKGHLRGLAKIDAEQATEQLNFQQWTQKGQMAITIEPEKGKRYQGVVPLESPELSQCLQDYFVRSEQLPTYIQLFASDSKVFGLFLQVLPGNSQQDVSAEEKSKAFAHVKALAETLSAEEALELSHQDLLYRLFHQDEVVLYPEKSLQFQCVCSRERNEKALGTIAPKELIEMVQESDGQLELACDFCNKKEVFTEQDIMALLSNNVASDSIN